jgi:hypothetical protein
LSRTISGRPVSTKVRTIWTLHGIRPQTSLQSLRDTLQEVIPVKQEQLKKLVCAFFARIQARVRPNSDLQKAEHGQTVVSDVKVCSVALEAFLKDIKRAFRLRTLWVACVG